MDMLLEYARELDVLNFVTPRDIIKGNIKLNTAFIAQIFNAFPSLEVEDQEDQLDDFDDMQYNDQTELFFEETREEKSKTFFCGFELSLLIFDECDNPLTIYSGDNRELKPCL